MENAIKRCWESGYRAFVAGLPQSACVFKKGSDARKAWERGWRKAEYDHAPQCD